MTSPSKRVSKKRPWSNNMLTMKFGKLRLVLCRWFLRKLINKAITSLIARLLRGALCVFKAKPPLIPIDNVSEILNHPW